MDRHIIILTTDNRQEALGNLFSGQRVRCSWEEYTREEICEKVYVLPTPVTKLDANAEIKDKLKQELTNCKGPVVVFAGALNSEWKGFLEGNGIVYWDFMKMPEVVEENAQITAEGTVAEALIHGQYSIRGQNVLVTGYGCCGKKIAKAFDALGAQVTVAARRFEVRKQILSDGYNAVEFSVLPELIRSMDTVINTVPKMVITKDVLRNMREDAMVIDIASRPGGTDFDAAAKYGTHARLALGLPGIYTTTSSAKALRDAIFKYAPLENDVRGEQQWIFQIIM